MLIANYYSKAHRILHCGVVVALLWSGGCATSGNQPANVAYSGPSVCGYCGMTTTQGCVCFSGHHGHFATQWRPWSGYAVPTPSCGIQGQVTTIIVETVDSPADNSTYDKPPLPLPPSTLSPSSPSPSSPPPATVKDRPEADPRPVAPSDRAPQPPLAAPPKKQEVPSAVQPSAPSKGPSAPPRLEVPTVEKPAVEKPTVEKPTVEKPTVEKPTVEKPTAEKPTDDEDAAEEGNVNDSSVEESSVAPPSQPVRPLDRKSPAPTSDENDGGESRGSGESRESIDVPLGQIPLRIDLTPPTDYPREPVSPRRVTQEPRRVTQEPRHAPQQPRHAPQGRLRFGPDPVPASSPARIESPADVVYVTDAPSPKPAAMDRGHNRIATETPVTPPMADVPEVDAKPKAISSQDKPTTARPTTTILQLRLLARKIEARPQASTDDVSRPVDDESDRHDASIARPSQVTSAGPKDAWSTPIPLPKLPLVSPHALFEALRGMATLPRPTSSVNRTANRSVRPAVALQKPEDQRSKRTAGDAIDRLDRIPSPPGTSTQRAVRTAGHLQMQQAVPRAGELPVDESFRAEDE